MTATTPVTYTGKDASIQVSGLAASVLGVGDFSLDIDRGTVEQELVGETANWFTQGAISAGGSLTNCKFGATVIDTTLGAIINGTQVIISGSVGTDSLTFYFASCQITSFDIALGDAATVTEGSLDFSVLDPYNINTVATVSSGVVLSDVTT